MHDTRSVAEEATSWLFVPGNRPDRFGKAARSGAHMVIVDLEDSVAPMQKEEARTAAQRFVASQSARGIATAVRTNAPDSDACRLDLAALASVLPHTVLLVPKVSDRQSLSAFCRLLPPTTPVIPIIESAQALVNLAAIAEAPRVCRLALGSIDLAFDLEMDESTENLRYARSCLVTRSRANRLPRPLDGVTQDYGDPEKVKTDAVRSRRSGFGGKLCIHPRQVPIVIDAFLYSADEIAWAQETLTYAGFAGAGAIGANGTMIDAPVMKRAQRILQRSASVNTLPKGHDVKAAS